MDEMDIPSGVAEVGGAILVAAMGLLVAKGRAWLKTQAQEKEKEEEKEEKEKAKEERKKSTDALPEALRAGRNIYVILNALLVELKAKRVLVLCASNGGGVPRPGGKLRATVIYEVYQGDGVDPVLRDFQEQALDEQYINLLLAVERENTATMVTEQMPRCMLKTIYLATGVKWSSVRGLFRSERNFFYVSILFDDRVPVGGAAEQEGGDDGGQAKFDYAINTALAKVRGILEKYYLHDD